MDYQPRAEHTVLLRALDDRQPRRRGCVWATPVRPHISPIEIVSHAGGGGRIGASTCTINDPGFQSMPPGRRTRPHRSPIVLRKKPARKNGIVVPMATVSLFFHPVFRDGGFHTPNDPEVRHVCCSKKTIAGDGHWSGARREDFCVMGVAAKGVETDALPPARTRRSSDCAKLSTIFANTTSSGGYGMRFALEAKPNEPRGRHLTWPQTGAVPGLHPYPRSS